MSVQTRPPRRPNFAGLPYECPSVFYDRFNTFADKLGICDDEDRTAEFLDCLTGDAAAFMRTLPAQHMPFSSVVSALKEEFGSAQVIRKLKIGLAKNMKKNSESAVAFTQTRLLLLQRLYPGEDALTSIERLCQLLPELVAANVALKEPETVEEFQRVLALVEAAMPPPAPKPRTSEAPKPPARELPQCFNCPGKHWHRDCPVLRQHREQGNGQGAGH